VNQTQIQTIIAPIVGIAVTWLATRFPLLDPATWNTLVTSVVFAGVAAFMGFITKKTSLADTVGNMPHTTVVTDAATANALPANESVVSNTDVKVVNK
jgi:hypothetical protein